MRDHTNNQPVILFDGICNLCNNWVQFVIKRDPEGHFHFASLQSDAASTLLKKHRYEHAPLNSIILVDGENLYTESTAILHIIRHLKGPIKTMSIFRVIPTFIRNPFYRFVARNRYKWFGKQESCMLPSEDTKKRFID
ncbi:hypothetical protein CN918_29725 [Priestia megaterium]|nr:hypothetical protein CN918_29725 [Priestia megaterium]